MEEQVIKKINKYINDLLSGSFDGRSDEEVKGYQTGLISIREKIRSFNIDDNHKTKESSTDKKNSPLNEDQLRLLKQIKMMRRAMHNMFDMQTMLWAAVKTNGGKLRIDNQYLLSASKEDNISICSDFSQECEWVTAIKTKQPEKQ